MFISQLKSQSTTQLDATHETPKHHYIDDLTFTFTAGTGMCSVKVCLLYNVLIVFGVAGHVGI